MGLKPKKAANKLPIGGRWDSFRAWAGGTPWATSPWYRLPGSDAAKPRVMMEKKIPMESTWAEFMKVAFMPAPAPRWSGGRLFMMAIWLGEKNIPEKSEKNRMI